MIKEIVKDPLFLSKPSSRATVLDIPIAKDLVDTLKAHSGDCVGMAANMIGSGKQIIVFEDSDSISLMYNPEIIKAEDEYEIIEGCLSLQGKRRTKRYKKILVRYQDESFKTREKEYLGWTAEIIQHEIDHCNGILI